MGIERNIIFIHPITKTLKDLKDSLEKDENAVIYELDSISEYDQVIGVVNHSITFSSDVKKTEAYLKRCRKINKKPTNKNILVQKKNVPPQMFTKYQRAGLNEVILEGTNIKSLLYKINMFFRPFEQALKKEEEERNKAVMGTMSLKKDRGAKDGEKEVYNNNERLRVEKTVDMSEGDDKFGKSKKHSGMSHDMMFNQNDSSHYQLRNSQGDAENDKNSSNALNRKKVNTFEAIEKDNQLKRSSFESSKGELKEGKRKKANFEEHEGELKRKKTTSLNLEFENELKKKKVEFAEAFEEMRKKSIQIEFQEKELKKKKQNLDLAESELKKKRKGFKEAELDYDKKRKKLDDVELDIEKKKGLIEELEAIKKKKNKMLDDIEDLTKKKNIQLEEALEKAKVKKMNFLENDPLNKKKGAHVEEIDLEKKKRAAFEAAAYEKKKLKFEEVEAEKKDRKKFEEENYELENKNKKFEEIGKGKKKYNQLDFEKQDYQIKRGTFEEVPRESPFKKEEQVEIERKAKLEEDFDEKDFKEFEEQIIDYGQFKKDKKKGLLKKEEEEKQRQKKKELERLLEEPEYRFYENLSYGLEYLVIHNDFLLKENMSSLELFKFIHFAMIKTYNGDISFYLISGVKSEGSPPSFWKCLYSGHMTRKNPILKNDFKDYEQKEVSRWSHIKVPYWSDETYQDDIIEFVYPYYEDGELLGVAVGHFENSIKSHADANKVELLCMCLKGSILFEMETKRKSA